MEKQEHIPDESPHSAASELMMLRARLALLEHAEAEHARTREQLHAEQRVTAALSRVARLLAVEHDAQRIAQVVTDEATALTGAGCGAFFVCPAGGDAGYETCTLAARSGVDSGAFLDIPLSRHIVDARMDVEVGSSVRDAGVVRYADVLDDSNPAPRQPWFGMPLGRPAPLPLPLPLRSYLAASVGSRSGSPHSVLCFGHPEPDRFTARHEQLVANLASHAAVALDNARLSRQVLDARARYRALFDGAADAIIVSDARGRFVDANPAAVTLLGYAPEELAALPGGLPALFADGAAAAQRLRDEFAGRDGWRGEAKARRKDGTPVVVEAAVRPVTLPDGGVYVASLRDVSERRTIERAQRELVSLVSHELKAPLTSLKGFAQLLQRRGTYNSRAVDTIVTQANHMQRLINDLLDVGRIGAAGVELRLSRCDLVGLARAVIEETRAASGRTPRLEAARDAVHGDWDHDRLAQALRHLLSNAVKYAPQGEIVVRVEWETDEARIGVLDAGPGIPPAAIPRLFQRFARVESVAQTSAQGLGLGLFITRALVEAHGGHVWVDSAPGQGSAFWLALPCPVRCWDTAGGNACVGGESPSGGPM